MSDANAPDKNATQMLSSEYDALREEVLMLLRLRYEILMVTTTLVGGVLGYAISTNSNYLSMIPLILVLLLLASAVMTFFQTRHSERIAAYISVAIEPYVTGLSWQRSVARHKALYNPWSYTKPLACTYVILGLLPLFLFVSIREHECLVGYCGRVGFIRTSAFVAASCGYGVLLWNYFKSSKVNMREQWMLTLGQLQSTDCVPDREKAADWT